MREDTITVDGVTLTTDEAREVVVFWNAHCCGVKRPECLWSSAAVGGQFGWFLGGQPRGPLLTPAIVEQLRDHVMPWVEVRRDEVKPGEVFRCADDPHDRRDLNVFRRKHDEDQRQHSGVMDGREGPVPYTAWMPSDRTVLVRRPRRPALTLGQVEPGQRFRFALSEGYVHRRTVQGWLEEATWMHATADDLHLTMPVEIVEGES